MILVSACLAGMKCRYDGKANSEEKILSLVKQGLALPVCPEQLGGLPTPRPASEIINDKVLTIDGNDVTENFRKGAEEVLRIAKLINCKEAILKQRSPSCGFGKIYDGTHSKKMIKGNGVTADILHKNGIKILTEEDF